MFCRVARQSGAPSHLGVTTAPRLEHGLVATPPSRARWLHSPVRLMLGVCRRVPIIAGLLPRSCCWHWVCTRCIVMPAFLEQLSGPCAKSRANIINVLEHLSLHSAAWATVAHNRGQYGASDLLMFKSPTCAHSVTIASSTGASL